jgi:hypothetical protein
MDINSCNAVMHGIDDDDEILLSDKTDRTPDPSTNKLYRTIAL